MAENLTIDKNKTEEEIYLSLLPQIKALINCEEPIISNLSNTTAALKEALDKISWVGFYLLKNDKLFLGPFQGKTACTTIKISSGVCGTSAQNKETIIVDDVDKFPGHIACDAGSKSEIVVPLIKNEKLIGVLDVDSYAYSSFNEIDKKYLEKVCELLCERLDLEKFILRDF
jgi:GAF domain-containing protein